MLVAASFTAEVDSAVAAWPAAAHVACVAFARMLLLRERSYRFNSVCPYFVRKEHACGTSPFGCSCSLSPSRAHLRDWAEFASSLHSQFDDAPKESAVAVRGRVFVHVFRPIAILLLLGAPAFGQFYAPRAGTGRMAPAPQALSPRQAPTLTPANVQAAPVVGQSRLVPGGHLPLQTLPSMQPRGTLRTDIIAAPAVIGNSSPATTARSANGGTTPVVEPWHPHRIWNPHTSGQRAAVTATGVQPPQSRRRPLGW